MKEGFVRTSSINESNNLYHKVLRNRYSIYHTTTVIAVLWLCIFLSIIDNATSNTQQQEQQPHAKCTSTSQYTVVGSIFSDKTSFTQGLTYGNGKLYASTGLYGQSKVREISKTNSTVIDNINLSNNYFGEGLAFYKDKLIQLTWKEQTGFIYKTTPKITLIETFSFTTTNNQGWGIAYNPSKSQFIVSDGSKYLHFWDERTLQETHKVAVTDSKGSSVKNLNELEYYGTNRILANIWYQDKILIINIKTGKVEEEIDFTTLWPKSERDKVRADVLNGITAFDNGEFLVTGKLWPLMYRIKFK